MTDYEKIEKMHHEAQNRGEEIFVVYNDQVWFVYDVDPDEENIRFAKYGCVLYGTFDEEMIVDDDCLIELEEFRDGWSEASEETVNDFIAQVLDPSNVHRAEWYEIKDDYEPGHEYHTDRVQLVKEGDPIPENAAGKKMVWNAEGFGLMYEDGSPIIHNAPHVFPKNPQAAFYLHLAEGEKDDDMRRAYTEVGLALEHNDDDSWKAYRELRGMIKIYDDRVNNSAQYSNTQLLTRCRDSLQRAVNGLEVVSPLAKYYQELRFTSKERDWDVVNIIERALVNQKGSVSEAVKEVRVTLNNWKHNPEYTVDENRVKMLERFLEELEWQM